MDQKKKKRNVKNKLNYKKLIIIKEIHLYNFKKN